MKLVDQNQLGELMWELMSARPAPGVSIYLTAWPGGAGARKDPIYLKNLLRKAEERLARRGVQPARRGYTMLAPLWNLVENRELWRRTAGGLALFSSVDLQRGLVWPAPFTPRCVVGYHFHTRPLIAATRDTRRYYVLAVSPKATRLLRCTRFATERVEHPLLPESMAAALPFDDPEPQLQYRTHPSGAGTGAVFHGHDEGQAPQNRDRRYLLLVRDAVATVLGDEQAPLVVAMTEALASQFLELNRYPHLVEDPVATSPDPLGDNELRDRAWERIEPLLRQEEERASSRLMDLVHTDRGAARVEEVVPLAAQGRVDSLFIAGGAERWGWLDEDQTVRIEGDGAYRPGRRELLDLAAQSTLLNRGRVYEVPAARMPGGAPVAAILRY